MLEIVSSFLFCVLIPFIVMGMLMRSLTQTAPTTENYRGTLVYPSLGIVWFIWLISLWAGAHFLVALRFEQPLWVAYIVPLFPLIAGSCALGLFDDLVGDKSVKGFRGHMRALLHGRLTTGGLKMTGIGLLSLFTAVSLYWTGISSLPRIVLVTCVIALMANLVNQFDLRPGRAGKVYSIGLALALLGIVLSPIIHLDWTAIVAVALIGIGPLVAVSRFDLGEKGMLGDAGANSMGAFLGFIYATSLSLIVLSIVTIILLVLTIIGERFSFSRLIEGNRVLRAVDKLGRKDII